MFCPDPVRAASEVHRVLRPGGRFALAVWDEPPRNPFFTVLAEVVSRFVPLPPPDPAAPGAFRLAPPGELDRVLRAAGFSTIAVEPRPMTFSFASPEEYWRVQADLASPLRSAIATLDASDLTRLEAAVLDVASRHLKDGAVRLAAVPLCARAVK
jgi:SAM-dependent methyltransferase